MRYVVEKKGDFQVLGILNTLWHQIQRQIYLGKSVLQNWHWHWRKKIAKSSSYKSRMKVWKITIWTWLEVRQMRNLIFATFISQMELQFFAQKVCYSCKCSVHYFLDWILNTRHILSFICLLVFSCLPHSRACLQWFQH